MVLLDGKKLAQKIAEELKKAAAGFSRRLRLGIVVVGKNPAVDKFIEQKKKFGRGVGIDVRVYPFDDSVTTNELRKKLAELVHEKGTTGVVIQLPLPEQVNTQYVLNSVTPEKDVDVLSARALGNFVAGKSPIMPPVAGAVKALFEEYKIDYKNKYTVLLGAGNLVGKPVALWLLNEKATFSMVRSETPNPEEFLKRADIIISGIGKPNHITGDMVKEGVVAVDAGTSESEGKVVGDIDFEPVSQKASFITPVPGGIGPLTVAMLFKNLVTLAQKQNQ